MRRECVFKMTFGSETHAVCSELFGVTDHVRGDCEFWLRRIITEPTRFGTDMDYCIWDRLSSCGVGDDETHFEVGVANPFSRLAESNERHEASDENREATEHEGFVCNVLLHGAELAAERRRSPGRGERL